MSLEPDGDAFADAAQLLDAPSGCACQRRRSGTQQERIDDRDALELPSDDALAERFQVAADVWSVTSYKELRRDALEVERWNRLHPAEKPRRSYVENLLAGEEGVFIAVTDYLKSLPEMIVRWLPGGLVPLGRDGFGRSENRPSLRRFFEVDAESITLAALAELARRGDIKSDRLAKAVKQLGIDPEKPDPVRS